MHPEKSRTGQTCFTVIYFNLRAPINIILVDLQVESNFGEMDVSQWEHVARSGQFPPGWNYPNGQPPPSWSRPGQGLDNNMQTPDYGRRPPQQPQYPPQNIRPTGQPRPGKPILSFRILSWKCHPIIISYFTRSPSWRLEQFTRTSEFWQSLVNCQLRRRR